MSDETIDREIGENDMKERPVLFNGPMNLAVLEDRKTQTRRPIKLDCHTLPNTEGRLSDAGVLQFRCPPENMVWRDMFWGNNRGPKSQHCTLIRNPLGSVGDLLYCRETWQDHCSGEALGYCLYRADMPLHWDAKDTEHGDDVDITAADIKWRPSIHMPKKDARTWLKVTGDGVERVQDISDADIEAEGILQRCGDVYPELTEYSCGDGFWTTKPFVAYARLWGACYSKPSPRRRKGVITHYESYPWAEGTETREHKGLPWYVRGNPFVWKTSFERIEHGN